MKHLTLLVSVWYLFTFGKRRLPVNCIHPVFMTSQHRLQRNCIWCISIYTNQRKAYFFLKAKKEQVISDIFSEDNQLLSTSTNISKASWHWTAPWNPILVQALSTRLMVTGQCIASEVSLRIPGELSSSLEINVLNWHYAYSYTYLHL